VHEAELRRAGAGLPWVAVRRLGITLLATIAVTGAHAAPAAAVDSYPCGKEVTVAWSPEPVQPCPLISPLAQGVPVYRLPVPNPQGHTPPAPAGWLASTTGRYFTCDRLFTGAMYYHPSGWRNNWWAITRDDAGNWGWVPEVFFRGGDDDEPDYGLRSCPDPPAPGPPPPPGPAPPGPCDPAPAAAGLRLRASLAGGRRALTVRYGRRVRVRGLLTGLDGAPRPAAPLCVSARNAVPGASRLPADSVVTGARGRFSYTLGAGPSRRVWLVHRSGPLVASASVLVRVRASARLRASRRRLRTGQSVLLRGQIRGRPLRSRLLVELQARRGSGWQTFATTRAGRGGAFAYRYRFTRTVGIQRYALRARLPSQPGYPYATGGSNAVRVTVSG
jgi:hypothetical protein